MGFFSLKVKYKDLLDSGAITEDEYNKVKAKLLGI